MLQTNKTAFYQKLELKGFCKKVVAFFIIC